MSLFKGFSFFKKKIVEEMNRLGMMVDLSKTNPDTMRAAIDVSQAPVIFSHSAVAGVCNHSRNIPDDILRALVSSTTRNTSPVPKLFKRFLIWHMDF